MQGHARRADAAAPFRGGRRKGRRCADDPARCDGAGRIVARRAQEKAQRVAGRGGERKTPHRHLIGAAGGRLADHHTDGATAQRLLHCPQHIARARGCDHDQMLGSNPGLLETRSIGSAIFLKQEILADPKHGCSLRNPSWRVTPPRTARETCRQPQCEAGRGQNFALAHRCDLMQRATAKPSAQYRVDRRNAEIKGSATLAGKPGCPLDCRQLLPQLLDARHRPWGGRRFFGRDAKHAETHVHFLF